jgi:hypothetical protein
MIADAQTNLAHGGAVARVHRRSGVLREPVRVALGARYLSFVMGGSAVEAAGDAGAARKADLRPILLFVGGFTLVFTLFGRSHPPSCICSRGGRARSSRALSWCCSAC